jgi:hypothetical protein
MAPVAVQYVPLRMNIEPSGRGECDVLRADDQYSPRNVLDVPRPVAMASPTAHDERTNNVLVKVVDQPSAIG